jgi:hypothetical protein
LCEYLSDNLKREYGFRYYVLDHARFSEYFVQEAGYTPAQIAQEKSRSAKEVLNSLLRVDFLGAQRHLSDSTSGGRAEELSRRLSRFYDRNLEKRGEDYDAMRALSESESLLNDHLARVFEPVLDHLASLGYPGVDNPRLVIKSALNPATIMSSHDGARVHYALGNPEDGTDANYGDSLLNIVNYRP